MKPARPNERINRWHNAAYADIKARLLAAMAEQVICAVDGSNGRKQQPRKPPAKSSPRA